MIQSNTNLSGNKTFPVSRFLTFPTGKSSAVDYHQFHTSGYSITHNRLSFPANSNKMLKSRLTLAVWDDLFKSNLSPESVEWQMLEWEEIFQRLAPLLPATVRQFILETCQVIHETKTSENHPTWMYMGTNEQLSIYIYYIYIYTYTYIRIYPMKHPFGIILTRSNSNPASIALKVLRSKPRKRPCRFSVSQIAGVIPCNLKTWVQSLQANEIEHLAMSRKFALENGGYDFSDCFCSRKQSPQKLKSAPPAVPSSHHSLW